MIGRPWTAVVLWAVVIEALIIWPSPPAVPPSLDIVGLDKIVHAALFGVQAALAARALRTDARPWWPAFVGVVVFGAFTEFEQSFIPTRSMEMGDFLADAVGAAVGLALFAVWAPRRRELHR